MFSYFPDSNASDVIRADALDVLWELYESQQDKTQLSEKEKRILIELAHDPGPKTRGSAVGFLCEVGPVTWDDLENWVTDPDEDVRSIALLGLGTSQSAVTELCKSDRKRCAEVLDLAFSTDSRCFLKLDMEMSAAARNSTEMLDYTWEAARFLLDFGNADLNSALICGYIEDMLSHYKLLKPEDPQVQQWIEKGGIEQKMALLSVVQWYGGNRDWCRSIAEMLERDKEKCVRATAHNLLHNIMDVPDIQMREWVEDST